MPTTNGTVSTTQRAELRAMQQQLGLTDDDFAELLQIHPKTLQHWYTGKSPVRQDSLLLARLLVQQQAEGAGLDTKPYLPPGALPALLTRPGAHCHWKSWSQRAQCKGRYLELAVPLACGVYLSTEACERHAMLVTHLAQRLNAYSQQLAAHLDTAP
jgi:hypothetical protein